MRVTIDTITAFFATDSRKYHVHLCGAATPPSLRQIPSRLQTHPQSGGGAKGLAKIERGIGCHASLTAYKFIEPSLRPSDLSCKRRLRNLSWPQKSSRESPRDETDSTVANAFFLVVLRTSAIPPFNDNAPLGLQPRDRRAI
jgi:hypothetical protein